MEYLIGLLLGVLLGISGTGGSLFAVPVLVLLLKIPVHEAMNIALGAVALSAFSGAYCRRHEISPRPALLIGIAGVFSAPLGRALAIYIDGFWLMVGFAVLASIGAASMWNQSFDKQQAAENEPKDADSQVLILAGLSIGFLSGMFGVGGGMLIVPFLLHVSPRGMQRTLATSLLIIAIISGAGFLAGLFAHPVVNITLLCKLSLASIIGTFLGRRFSQLLPQNYLSKLIALLLMAVSLFSLSARADS